MLMDPESKRHYDQWLAMESQKRSPNTLSSSQSPHHQPSSHHRDAFHDQRAAAYAAARMASFGKRAARPTSQSQSYKNFQQEWINSRQQQHYEHQRVQMRRAVHSEDKVRFVLATVLLMGWMMWRSWLEVKSADEDYESMWRRRANPNN